MNIKLIILISVQQLATDNLNYYYWLIFKYTSIFSVKINETMKPNQDMLPERGDALILVDVQNDFLPGGSLAVPDGDKIIPELNNFIQLFKREKLPIFATRDWHPENHCSFKKEGGIWPVHCVAGTAGADFPEALNLSDEIVIISKARDPSTDAYSGLDNTDLNKRLKILNIKRVWVGGLATDYCVINTVRDLISEGYLVNLLLDAIRAVNINPEDGQKAEREMIDLGARPI
jgi:nicotinamidase/pyrazinamidase